LIDWTADAAVHNIVKTWPSRIHAVRAAGLGLMPESSFDDIVRAYVRENTDAVKLPVR
jgi:hypothetical protein